MIDEEDGILAGRGHVLAAYKLGWEECPVIVARAGRGGRSSPTFSLIIS